MRRIVLNSLGLGMVLVLASACTSGPESTIEAPAGEVDDGVRGGEIIVSGDLTAGAEADDPGTAETASAGDESTTTSTTRSSTAPSTTASPTRTPTTTAARTATATTTKSTTAPATSNDPPVGDGPVLTSPIGNGDSGESPGIGNGLKPVFFALEGTIVVECATADPGTVRLRWEVIGTESVDVSIGFVGNIRSADESPAGTIDLPLDCATGSQYFVIAENPDGETIRSVTVAAR